MERGSEDAAPDQAIPIPADLEPRQRELLKKLQNGERNERFLFFFYDFSMGVDVYSRHCTVSRVSETY